MSRDSIVAVVGAVCISTAVVSGQSINIRFGTTATTPSATYAAAGTAGIWNTFQVTTAGVRQPLVGLSGAPVAARYYQIGNSSMLSFDNPLTSGDDERLMDSMILSNNNPTDGCFWVEGLTLGLYEVTMYALTPNSASLLNRTRVDNGVPGPVMVGGTWPGHHQATVTYARFTVTTTDGVIAFHDGLPGGVIQSGINGVQLEYLPPGGARAINYGFGCQPAAPLTLSASARPVLGTAFRMVTSNIPATALISINWLGIVQHDPGIELTGVGMPGCFLYLDPIDTFLMTGSGTQSRSFTLPNDLALRGARVFSQSASIVPAVNPLGALSSNGTILLLGSL